MANRWGAYDMHQPQTQVRSRTRDQRETPKEERQRLLRNLPFLIAAALKENCSDEQRARFRQSAARDEARAAELYQQIKAEEATAVASDAEWTGEWAEVAA